MSLDETVWDEIPPLKQAFYQKKHLLEKALERGRELHTIEDIEEVLDQGRAQFFDGEHSCMVVELLERNGTKYAHIWLAGGDLEELLDMEEYVCCWAKSLGCSFVSVDGRTGWERPLRHKNYTKVRVLLRKEL